MKEIRFERTDKVGHLVYYRISLSDELVEWSKILVSYYALTFTLKPGGVFAMPESTLALFPSVSLDSFELFYYEDLVSMKILDHEEVKEHPIVKEWVRKIPLKALSNKYGL